MSNEYYDHTTYPAANSLATSSGLRAELDAVEAGFNKLPILTGNQDKPVKVKADGSGLEAGAIAKSDVGLGNVTNDAQLKIASNLSDLASAATARTNLGLGTAATANVTTSTTDTTAGRLLKVWDFGLGVGADGQQTPVSDLNSIVATGFYRADSSASNRPSGMGDGVVLHSAVTATISTQVCQSRSSSAPMVFTRINNSGTWTPWREIYHQGSILGTVSQSGGIPTGAIIERGSNANGEYVRFANGTQICTRIETRSADGSTADSGYRSWTFPAAFATASVATSFSVSSSAGSSRRMVNLFMIGTTTVGDYRYDMISPAVETLAEKALAIGRWF